MKSSGKNHFIYRDLRRLAKSPRPYISLFFALLILLHTWLISYISNGFRLNISATFSEALTLPFATSGFTPFAAVFCVLPFADSFCEDYLSGYVRFVSMRIGTKNYAGKRCLTVMLSGGILMAAVVGITLLVCAILATEPETYESASILGRSLWGRMDLVVPYHGRLMAAGRIFLAFLFGGLWALVGLTVSTFIVNRYLALIAPFVIYQLLWILLAETTFNPVYMLRGDADFLLSLPFVIFHQIAWIILLSIVSYKNICKKVEAL